jgi:hypothetical protein
MDLSIPGPSRRRQPAPGPVPGRHAFGHGAPQLDEDGACHTPGQAEALPCMYGACHTSFNHPAGWQRQAEPGRQTRFIASANPHRSVPMVAAAVPRAIGKLRLPLPPILGPGMQEKATPHSYRAGRALHIMQRWQNRYDPRRWVVARGFGKKVNMITIRALTPVSLWLRASPALGLVSNRYEGSHNKCGANREIQAFRAPTGIRPRFRGRAAGRSSPRVCRPR